MHVAAAAPAPQERSADSSETEDEDLDRVSVLSRKSERSRELVVNLVDVLVEGAVVHDPVHGVVPGVLHHEEQRELRDNLSQAGEGHLPRLHSDRSGEGVEQVDLQRRRGRVVRQQLSRVGGVSEGGRAKGSPEAARLRSE